MRPQSCKQKGRVLQQLVRDKILAKFPQLEPDDVRSTSMGASGEDVLLSPAARKVFPFSIECKNVEKVNVWASWEQAASNAGSNAPLLVIKRNRKAPLAVIELDKLMELLG